MLVIIKLGLDMKELLTRARIICSVFLINIVSILLYNWYFSAYNFFRSDLKINIFRQMN